MKWVSERDLGGTAAEQGVRLFCLPHAGSGAAAFHRWKRLLPDFIRVCPVLLPGREVRLREEPLRSVRSIVDGLQAELAGALDQPYAIFGHSMGALLAFEWARRIEADGSPGPLCVFASGRQAPQLPLAHRALHKLDDEEFVAELNARYGGVPEGFLADRELSDVFLPILRADLAVVETYEFQEGTKLSAPIFCVAGSEDRSVSGMGLRGWRDVCSGDFSSRRFPGDHFFHFGARQADLLQTIAESLGPGGQGVHV